MAGMESTPTGEQNTKAREGWDAVD